MLIDEERLIEQKDNYLSRNPTLPSVSWSLNVKKEEEKKQTDSLEHYHSFDFDIDSIQPIEKKEKPKVNSTQRRRVGLSLAQYLAETNN